MHVVEEHAGRVVTQFGFGDNTNAMSEQSGHFAGDNVSGRLQKELSKQMQTNAQLGECLHL